MPSVALAVSGDTGIFPDQQTKPLHSSTVAIGDDQRRVLVPPGELWTEPGSRVLTSATQQEQLRLEEADWQRLSRVPGTVGEAHLEAARLALLDLRVLTLGGAMPVAAWSPAWRYVWPRDSAFVVAALAVSGHGEDAVRILDFIQQVQAVDGTFQARYRPGSNRPPDDRGVQLDGIGWSLWGLWRWARSLPPATRAQQLWAFVPLLDRSAAACLRLTAGGTSLPPPSPDYWELKTKDVTLGNAALFLVGFEAAAKLYSTLGNAGQSAALAAAGRRYRAVIARSFSPNGYPRLADGQALDAAVCFLLPPFVDDVDPRVVAAWRKAHTQLRRAAGGLAPGASWKQDGVSWTPETALFAMTALGIGDRQQARSWLDWLLAHRTIAGSFSETVNADGSPASAAPLAWTTATVVLAVHGEAERAV